MTTKSFIILLAGTTLSLCPALAGAQVVPPVATPAVDGTINDDCNTPDDPAPAPAAPLTPEVLPGINPVGSTTATSAGATPGTSTSGSGSGSGTPVSTTGPTGSDGSPLPDSAPLNVSNGPMDLTAPTIGPATSGSSSRPYVTDPDTNNVTISHAVHNGVSVTYYRGRYTYGFQPQNLAVVKSYDGPTSGLIRSIGGQRIQVSSSSVDVDGLDRKIVNIIDELHLTAAALGLPKPVITSALDGEHSNGSLHGQGLALDLRCNTVASDACIGWAVTLKQALGPGYDAMFEDWGDGNSHIHVEYDGKP